MTDPYARFTICPACEGAGGHDSLGGFTGADMDEWYGGDGYEREQFVTDYLGGAYDTPCTICRGQRVVLTSALAEIEEKMIFEAEIEAQYRAESPYSY